MILLSIPEFSFAKEHKFLSGRMIKHVPDHLGAAIGGLIGGALGEPIPTPSQLDHLVLLSVD
jgi:hypothetical protein